MITPVSCISCSIFDPLSMWDISKISTGIPTAWRTASMNPTNRSPRSLLSTGRSRPPFSVAAFHKFSFLFFQYIIFYLLLPPIYPEFLIKPVTTGQHRFAYIPSITYRLSKYGRPAQPGSHNIFQPKPGCHNTKSSDCRNRLSPTALSNQV